MNHVMVVLLLVIPVIYVTLVYAPIAAFLVQLFPTRPLHLDVAAVSHRQRLVRRFRAADRHFSRGHNGQHSFGPAT